jgi:hypothetical protein
MVSTSDIRGILVVVLLVLFWVGIWNLTEELVEWIEDKYKIKDTVLYGILVVVVLAIIVLDPYMFEKFVN